MPKFQKTVLILDIIELDLLLGELGEF